MAGSLCGARVRMGGGEWILTCSGLDGRLRATKVQGKRLDWTEV